MLLPSCLLLLAAALRGGLAQGHRVPPLLRLRRLEGQFRRLQEVTLSHLQSIARNYNISYNIDERFQALAEQAEAAAAAQAALGAELAHLAIAGRRLHRRLKQLERTVGVLSRQHCPLTHPPGAAVEAGTELHSLFGTAQSRGSQLEQELQGQVTPSSPSPQHSKVRWQHWEEGHQLPDSARPSGAPREDEEPLRDAAPAAQATAPTLSTVPTVPWKQPGEDRYGPLVPAPTSPAPTSSACPTGTVLLFPNSSAENMAVLVPRPHQGLWALSLCAWLASSAPRLGALLSYTTEDGGSELAVRGDLPSSVRFIIGDRQFRELPVMPLLDGKWHHFCLTWSASQGQYRFYMDRRLLAAGSGFQQGYEIPPGGSLVLGQEQKRPGKDFGITEAFVGHVAGFALWSRALLPGEVASMATGRGLPRGPYLTLANASLHGRVQKMLCSCNEPGGGNGAESWQSLLADGANDGMSCVLLWGQDAWQRGRLRTAVEREKEFDSRGGTLSNSP